jgi:EAL domain-containing protein (putative c-di-GMP-specific phosphodiesterase class I)/ActR/RegA family two-component response regulator
MSDMSDMQFNSLNALVIDDDAFMRNLVGKTLRRLGLASVESVDGGHAALARLQRDDTCFHILLIDLLMPEMDGVELLRHLAEREYQGGIILLSGAEARVLKAAVSVARERYLNVLGFLQKPVSADALTHYLRCYDDRGIRISTAGASLLSLNELREGLRNDHLRLFFQPQVDMRSRRMVAVEALSRWQHPVHGLLGPNSFIPLAESCKLVVDLTETVIDKAFQQMQRWHTCQQNFRMAINISTSAVSQMDLTEYLDRCCEHYALEPRLFTLEVTESQVGQDLLSLLETMTRLKLKGFGLSIDDFGTGYSTLERLRRIPFDELKIDSSFVHGSQLDQAAQTIFRSSVELGKQLEMSIVAEGVENEEDWQSASSLGCDIGQGFHIARPMPARELEPWWQGWNPNS